jgi:hypothetical protein
MLTLIGFFLYCPRAFFKSKSLNVWVCRWFRNYITLIVPTSFHIPYWSLQPWDNMR